ncbi:MAG TPA: DUF3857 domain-containing protein [Candidatus Acidoferrales bacterium]|nr:DUF3857 domain-containing protein [Candidatus Acidoferrales bacterium]
MRLTNFLSLFSGFCVISLVLAFPAGTPAADEWQPINPADLALKDNPASPGSHAMILYRREHTDSEQSFVTEYYRIKIFTEEGKSQADVEVPFIKGRDHVEDIRARTIRPDGSIVPFAGQVFEKEIVKAGGIKVLEKTFTLPDVQPGCIIEYMYKLQKDSDYYWDVSWSVQQDLFTRDADFSIHAAGLSSSSYSLYFRSVNVGQPVNLQKQKNGEYTLALHNIPGMTDEDYMVPKDMLRGRVEFIFKPDSLSHLSKDAYWKQMDKTINQSVDDYINKKNALQQIVAATTTASDSPETKLRKLYARVQLIRNLSYEDRTTQEWKRQKIQQNNNVEDVLKRNYGDNREINDVFIGLARAAGFEANQVLLAPRDEHFFYPDFQDVSELNDDIVCVKLDGRDLFLDPAAKFYPFGLLPWNETGVTGLRINREGGDFVQVVLPRSSDSVTERHATLHLGEDGSLSGTLEVDYTGVRASSTRQEERADDEAGRKKDITDEIKRWLPSSAKFDVTKISGWEDSSVPLVISGTLTIPSYAASAGHRLLLPLTPFIAPEPRSFQSPTRVNNVYFAVPYQQRDDVSITLPASYQLESLPQNIPNVPEGAIRYTMLPTKQGNILQVKRTLDVEDSIYPASLYGSIRHVFSLVKTGDDEQAVLEAATSAHQN